MEINGSSNTAVATDDDLKEMESAETLFMDAIKGIAVEAAGEIEDADTDKEILEMIEAISDTKKINTDKEILDAFKEFDEKSKVKKEKTKSEEKTLKKVKSTVKSTESQSEVENPWGSLKESTLRRKTIAQLTAYLEEREVNVAAGMSKKELVGTIQNL
mmetsp:Transcript_23413/g.29509  ORF Transcript_23413/g.29509 Transcript_23413/m.29509 type:complete len:159 (-) Transcript_23413:22-498(-)